MAEVERQKGVTDEQLIIRVLSAATSLPYELMTFETPGLSLWYRRDGEERVDFEPVELESLDAPFNPGGVFPIDDGYYRVDIPDEAFADGEADSVQVGGSATGLVFVGVQVRLTAAAGPFNSSGSSALAGASETIPCDGIIPEAPMSEREGCPIRTKRRYAIIDQGVSGEIQWTMRTRDGRIADLSTCLPSDSSSGSASDDESNIVAVKFQTCDGVCVSEAVTADVLDAEAGLIQFAVPDEVSFGAGVYVFQAALVTPEGRVRFVDSGLLSVERGLWGANENQGPPSIEEIRAHLRDRADENTLLMEVEFDNVDILEAIRRPVQQFNEMPPPLNHYHCSNFPFRYHWLSAIVAELLKSAAHHYLRNKLQVNSGGLSVDDKNKNAEYMQMAMLYEREWKEFAVHTKARLNADNFFGSC